MPSQIAPLGFTADVSCWVGVTESEASARTGQFAPKKRIGIVTGEHGHTVNGQRTQHLTVFDGYCLDRAHKLLMLTLGVVDQRHRGLRHGSQDLDFAGVVHTQLHHSQAVVVAQAQQCLRHTQIVVQVALCGQGIVACAAHGCAQDTGHHLRHRGFTVAAGHGNQRQAETAAPQCGQLTQGQTGVGHVHTWQMGSTQTLFSHGSDRTGRRSLWQEGVCVERFPFQRHEQVAGLE